MRYVQIYGEGAIYDLCDGSLSSKPIGEWCGRKICSAEALLIRIEQLCGKRIIDQRRTGGEDRSRVG